MTQTLIQLTDTHIHDMADACFKGSLPHQYLQRIIRQILLRHGQPDHVVVTGDLTHDGGADACRHLARLLNEFSCPVYVTAGNHDDADLIRQHVLSHTISMPDSIQLEHWQLLFADSHVAQETGGQISPAQLKMMRQQLEQCARPALLFTHHPPICIDSEWMDKIGMKNGAEFLQQLSDYPQLQAVIFGHIHQQWHSRFEHIRLLGTPATCVQFKPLSDEFAIDNSQPGYRLFKLHDTGVFESEVRRCSMQLQTIMSGGQTGVDRAALDTAMALAIPHGGWCPQGRRAEDGPISDHYRLEQTPSMRYAQRTEWNVRDSDATLVLTPGSPTGGTALTCQLAQAMNKPVYVMNPEQKPDRAGFTAWLESHRIHRLNIAGPRESGQPGIYQTASNFLRQLWS